MEDYYMDEDQSRRWDEQSQTVIAEIKEELGIEAWESGMATGSYICIYHEEGFIAQTLNERT